MQGRMEQKERWLHMEAEAVKNRDNQNDYVRFILIVYNQFQIQKKPRVYLHPLDQLHKLLSIIVGVGLRLVHRFKMMSPKTTSVSF